jgi:thioesterase domain-containing protein
VSAPVLLEELYKRGVQLSVNGDRLRCNAPAGALTPELQKELRERKDELLKFLQDADVISRRQPAIVPLQAQGMRPPVFAVAGHNGDVFCYRTLARHLGENQPFFGLQPPGLDGHSEPFHRVESLAEYFAKQIEAFHPDGPCIIAGYCAGGSIAFELASRLQQRGRTIAFLAMFACPYPSTFRYSAVRNLARRVIKYSSSAAELKRLLGNIKDRFQSDRNKTLENESAEVLARRTEVEKATLIAVRRYVPNYFHGRACFFLPNQSWAKAGFDPLRWKSVVHSSESYFGPELCNMEYMLRGPDTPLIAQFFEEARAAKIKQ